MGVIGRYFGPAGAPPASGSAHPAFAELLLNLVVRDGAADHRKFSMSMRSLLSSVHDSGITVFRGVAARWQHASGDEANQRQVPMGRTLE
jgi:hypothetical protein